MQNCYFPATAAPAAAAGTEEQNDKDVQMEEVMKQTLRFDRIRKSRDEMRQAFMKCGIVSGAAGSAYVELNRTRVVCAVYGPRNDTRSRKQFSSNEGQLVCDFKYAPFADATGRRERGQVRRLLPYCVVPRLEQAHFCARICRHRTQMNWSSRPSWNRRFRPP